MNESLFPVEDYLIQRGRMMLIDAIVAVDEQSSTTRARTTRQWPLYENGSISPIVIVELVAQSAGVSIRWEENQKHGSKKNKGGGLIVGIKEAVFFVSSIPVDARIITCSRKHRSQMNYAEYTGVSTIEDNKLGEVTLQVLRTD